ncbi:MAG: hypothetical protein NTX44_08385 [Ignavibacteriales bacterium]|nr:hypothetical protein [Ignavibacteriales bacterium]
MNVARTVRNETKAISLRLSDLNNGEYLLYKLKVWGSQGIFSIVDEKSRVLMKYSDFPNPQQEYLLKWPKTPADIPAENDIIYTLAVSFMKATKYSYAVEHYKADGSSPVTLKSIDFESQKALDSDYNTLRILLTQ